MNHRLRSLSFGILVLLTLFVGAACERYEQTPFMAEVDEPGYRRGKELLRQGRNQEALTEFQKVIEKRGLNNSAESHLEIGLLYQYHIRDPIAAIYHYRRFRELKPTSPQSDLVRQRIDAATREFARTLPAQPLDNLERLDMTDVVQRLQRENEVLKQELVRARTQVTSRPRPDALGFGDPEAMVETDGPAYVSPGDSPISSPGGEGPLEAADALPPPTRPNPTPAPALAGTSNRTVVPSPTPTPTATAARRHVIAKGDTLFSLAQRYYGNRSRWKDIFEANRDQLRSREDPLKIGMELRIPQ